MKKLIIALLLTASTCMAQIPQEAMQWMQTSVSRGQVSSATPWVDPFTNYFWSFTLTNATQTLETNFLNHATLLPDVATGPVSTRGAGSSPKNYYTFDSTDDAMLCTSNIPALNSTAYTVAYWMYITNYLPTQARRIMSQCDNVGNHENDFNIDLNGRLTHVTYEAGYANVTNSALIPSNTWVHVAWAVSNTTSRCFVNGEAGSTGIVKTVTATTGVKIGDLKIAAANYKFGGRLAYVHVYTNTLSAGEVLNLYNGELTQ